jgi:hypothetical protein
MQTLPNILPAANADSLNSGGAMTFPGPVKKNDEAFDCFVTRALSLSSNNANIPVEQIALKKNVAQNFLLPPENSKPSAPASGKNRTKMTDGNSAASKNSSAAATDVAAINSENVLIQIVAPVLPQAEVSVADAKIAAGKFGEILTASPEVKNQGQSATKINPAVKTDDQGKIATAVEALAVGKTNSTDSKISEPTATNPQVAPAAQKISGDLTNPMLADKSSVPSAQTEFSSPPDLREKIATQTEPEVNGTPVAKQDATMNKTEKPDKTARLTGKILPGAGDSVERENNLPSRENFSAAALSRAGQMAANVTANSSASNNANDAAPVSAAAANAILNGNLSEVRSRALERAQDIIVLHADRLSESGNASLQVVIKPGAGTQLSLELRQRGDGVEAQAVLQRGDFNHLNQQWPALQQQLEQRGIRLAPLIDDGNFAGGGENNFQHNQNQSAESDLFPAGAFAEVALASPFAPSATHAGTHRGWESWA